MVSRRECARGQGVLSSEVAARLGERAEIVRLVGRMARDRIRSEQGEPDPKHDNSDSDQPSFYLLLFDSNVESIM